MTPAPRHPASNRLLGCHLSIAGGVSRAVDRARAIGCTAFQIFTRNPRGWAFGPLEAEEAARFREGTSGGGPVPVAHMPYLPNLAGPEGENRSRSIATLTAELERCASLGIESLVTHLGSHLGTGEEDGRRRIAAALREALDRADGPTRILMENTAGTKNSLGTTPEELSRILELLGGDTRIGICIDTAHAFAAGYDWRTEPERLGQELRAAGILDRVHVLHFNDSDVACGGRADRHAHLGLGEIGAEALRRILGLPDYAACPIILETPVDEIRDDEGNVAYARSLLEGRLPPEPATRASRRTGGKPARGQGRGRPA